MSIRTQFAFAFTLFLCLSTVSRADDLFREDGRVTNHIRTFRYAGRTYENVQLGKRLADGIEVYHKNGLIICQERDLPAMWVKALARREAEKMAPPADPAASKPATAEKAQAEKAYREKMAKGILSATQHLVRPVPINARKADGQLFTGELIALKQGELLIADGKNVAWVPDSWFASGRTIRRFATPENCPELYATERQAAEKIVMANAKIKWPDNFDMQNYEYDKQMKAWDRQHPSPLPRAGDSKESSTFDPFAK